MAEALEALLGGGVARVKSKGLPVVGGGGFLVVHQLGAEAAVVVGAGVVGRYAGDVVKLAAGLLKGVLLEQYVAGGEVGIGVLDVVEDGAGVFGFGGFVVFFGLVVHALGVEGEDVGGIQAEGGFVVLEAEGVAAEGVEEAELDGGLAVGWGDVEDGLEGGDGLGGVLHVFVDEAFEEVAFGVEGVLAEDGVDLNEGLPVVFGEEGELGDFEVCLWVVGVVA